MNSAVVMVGDFMRSQVVRSRVVRSQVARSQVGGVRSARPDPFRKGRGRMS